jgi:hypothetical protein
MKRTGPSKFLLLALLPAMLWLFLNTTLNRHIHVLADGYIITHSHPYKKSHDSTSPLDNHKHNKRELLLFGLYSVIVFAVMTLLFLEPRFQEQPAVRRVRMTHAIPVRELYFVNHYHAPPGTCWLT